MEVEAKFARVMFCDLKRGAARLLWHGRLDGPRARAVAKTLVGLGYATRCPGATLALTEKGLAFARSRVP